MTNQGAVLLNVLVYFLLLTGTSFILNFLWASILDGRKIRIIFFPGVIVHELSHALGCLLTGAKIKKISLFKKAYVAHTAPKIPLIGNFIVSFSPVAGAIAFLALIFWFFKYDFPLVGLSLEAFMDSFFALIGEVFRFFSGEYNSWQFWVFSYLSLSVIMFFVPSKQDIKNALLSIFFVFIFLLAFLYFGFFSELIIGFLNNYLIGIMGVGVFFGFLALAVTLPVYLVKKIIL